MERRDPDLAGDERTLLTQFLDYHRATLLWKVEALDEEQLARTTAASSMTLAGLVNHLALVEDQWFRVVLLGEEPAEPWRDVDWKADWDWDWHSATDLPVADLLARYERACAASRDAVASMPSLDALSPPHPRPPHDRFSVRWILLHMIEETARHNGHADLLREAIDGATGE
jgi:uncharacterized damage-inducible protein DinB